ncbi:Uncharacterised protein [Collinsella intestinalis]|nr:Uncharacterised protein [Collinsella intestinalis]
MSDALGSSTSIAWKRRSNAGSFARYLRNSSAVVAPMIWKAPRARTGLSMELASIEPSAEPAPISVCISSMNKMMSSASVASAITLFRRSSNSPRYFAPATSPGKSSVQMFWPMRFSGTLPAEISCASPSTMAVLPTPGSPRMSGLFLVRRERISIMREISFSRPMTGSSLPSRASCVRLVPNCASTLSGLPPAWPCAPPPKNGRPAPGRPEPAPARGRCLPWSLAVSFSTAPRTLAPETPRRRRMSTARPLPSLTMASSRCSVET